MLQSKVQSAAQEVAPRRTPRCDIFISYRREGGSELAQLLRKALHERGYRIFVDVHDMPSGPFDQSILDAIFHCKDVIVLLTPGSLERCREKGDWFRTEIAAAFECKRNIVPLRANGFHMPDASSLPAEIAPLRFQQSASYSHEHSDAAVDQLCRLLNSRPRHTGRHVAIAVVVVLVALAILAATISQRRPHEAAIVPQSPAGHAIPMTLPATEAVAANGVVKLVGKPFNGTKTGTLGGSSPFMLTIGSQTLSGAVTGWVTTVGGRGPETTACSGRFDSDGTLFIHYRTGTGHLVLITGKVSADGKTFNAKYVWRADNRDANSGNLVLTR